MNFLWIGQGALSAFKAVRLKGAGAGATASETGICSQFQGMRANLSLHGPWSMINDER